ncbi:MAG TPA: lasso peptide biosynthesis B2 protein, partial [Hyphomicrobiales bacterium]|nr:lasso peptide biosynthesis B2 protein [Hyphomicrobiales bacterium]
FAKRVRFRTELWIRARLLPLQIRGRNLSSILRSAEPAAHGAYRGLEARYIVRRVRKAVRRPVQMRDRRCLREGLLAYRFLRQAGFAPELVFGVDKRNIHGPDPTAHCWIRLDGAAILNPPEPDMTAILYHPTGTGAAAPVEPSPSQA